MAKWIVAAVGAVALASLAQLGCQEHMVGAPCIPETDKGDFAANLSGTTWSIETRSVQCEERICLTKTEPNDIGAYATVCEDNPNLENCWEGESGPVQVKYSFCSCRCTDIAGNTYNKNPDKYDYLCECPPNTTCVDVLSDIEEAPEKVKGSYCVPNCIAGGECTGYENDDGDWIDRMCMPSTDSEKPWQWKCTEFDPSED